MKPSATGWDDLQVNGLDGVDFSAPGLAAEDVDRIALPSTDRFQHWQEFAGGNIVLHALAPELDGAIPCIEAVAGSGVAVSLGHHLAGSSLTLDACMAHPKSLGLFDEDELLEVGRNNPLRLIGKTLPKEEIIAYPQSRERVTSQPRPIQ